MKIKIPSSKLLMNIDDLTAMSHQFFVILVNQGDCITIEGESDAIQDFLTAYHNLDILAAKEDMEKYDVVASQSATSYTPEFALQKINEFVLSKGGFDGYDQAFEVLNNALSGIF